MDPQTLVLIGVGRDDTSDPKMELRKRRRREEDPNQPARKGRRLSRLGGDGSSDSLLQPDPSDDLDRAVQGDDATQEEFDDDADEEPDGDGDVDGGEGDEHSPLATTNKRFLISPTTLFAFRKEVVSTVATW